MEGLDFYMSKLNLIKSNKKLLFIIPIATMIFFCLFIIIARSFNKPNSYNEKIYLTSETVLEKQPNNNLLVRDVTCGKEFVLKNYINYDKVKINGNIRGYLFITQNNQTGEMDYMIITN